MKQIGMTLLLLVAVGCASNATDAPAEFATPEAAVEQMVAAMRVDDTARIAALLGPDGWDLVHSGDDVADRNGRLRVVEAYDEKHHLEEAGEGSYVLCVGELDWPVPVPIVQSGESWIWDAAAGREELLNRRIGRNELDTIQVCLAIRDAQMEYVARDWDGDGIQEYAQRFLSTEGAKDGLYWEVAEGEEPSPLGALAAEAASEEYRARQPGEAPRPFHGYYYRLLSAQGENAPGGAYGYLAGEHMIGGFAILAWPATYGVSGIMTFAISHDGTVYQGDLGEETEKAAHAMTLFDPGPGWQPVED